MKGGGGGKKKASILLLHPDFGRLGLLGDVRQIFFLSEINLLKSLS